MGSANHNKQTVFSNYLASIRAFDFDFPLIESENEKINAKESLGHIHCLAGYFFQLGIRKNDRIVFLNSENPSNLLIEIAIQMVGAQSIFIDSTYEQKFLPELFENLNIRIAFIENIADYKIYFPILKNITKCELIVCMEESEEFLEKTAIYESVIEVGKIAWREWQAELITHQKNIETNQISSIYLNENFISNKTFEVSHQDFLAAKALLKEKVNPITEKSTFVNLLPNNTPIRSLLNSFAIIHQKENYHFRRSNAKHFDLLQQQEVSTIFTDLLNLKRIYNGIILRENIRIDKLEKKIAQQENIFDLQTAKKKLKFDQKFHNNQRNSFWKKLKNRYLSNVSQIFVVDKDLPKQLLIFFHSLGIEIYYIHFHEDFFPLFSFQKFDEKLDDHVFFNPNIKNLKLNSKNKTSNFNPNEKGIFELEFGAKTSEKKLVKLAKNQLWYIKSVQQITTQDNKQIAIGELESFYLLSPFITEIEIKLIENQLIAEVKTDSKTNSKQIQSNFELLNKKRQEKLPIPIVYAIE